MDVNECAAGTHTCSQVCTNTNGSYSCSCNEGFRLSDSMSGVCRALKEDVNLIYPVALRSEGMTCRRWISTM